MRLILLLLFLSLYSVISFAQKEESEKQKRTFNFSNCAGCKTTESFDCADLEDCPNLIDIIEANDKDEQVLTAIGNATTGTTQIQISNGNTINILHPPSADDQTLTYDRETKRLTIEDGNTIDLTLYPTWTTLTAPTVAGAGTYTTNLSQVLETDTEWYTRQNGDCREKYYFHYSMRGTHAAGSGWGFVDVPQPAGWDRDIYDVGTYRQAGNTNNPDNPVQGAMPDAPYMGKEAKHWRNGGRIYLNQFRDRDNASTFWLEFTTEYKRN